MRARGGLSRWVDRKQKREAHQLCGEPTVAAVRFTFRFWPAKVGMADARGLSKTNHSAYGGPGCHGIGNGYAIEMALAILYDTHSGLIISQFGLN